MKCIKKHGEIKRVKDEEAKKLVETMEWSFCSKKEWKESKK